MRLVVRLLGCEVLDIDLSDGEDDESNLSLGGTTSSVGFEAPPLTPREGADWGEDQ